MITRLILCSFLTLLWSTAAAQATSKEDHLGFRIRVPKGWEEIPTTPSDKERIAKWQFPRAIRGFEASMDAFRFERERPKKEGEKKDEKPATDVVIEGFDLSMFGAKHSYVEWLKASRPDAKFKEPQPMKLAKKPKKGLEVDVKLLEGTVSGGFISGGVDMGDWALLVGIYTFETHEYAIEFLIHEKALKKERTDLIASLRSLEFTDELDELIAKTKAAWEEKEKPAVATEAGEPGTGNSGDNRYARSETEKEKTEKAFKESLERAKKDAENVPGWSYIVSPSERYIIVTNIDRDKTNNQVKLRKVIDCLEAVRDYYEELFPPHNPITAVSIVRICKDRETYLAYGGSGGSAGYWYSVDKELVLYFEGQVEFTFAVLRHEAFHQYIFYSAGDIAPHSWFNEGYGDYFAGLKVSGRKVTGISPFAWRTDIAKSAARDGSYTPLEKLVRMSQGEYYANANLNYAMGWSLVYFLKEGVAEGHPWTKILTTYFDELKLTSNKEKAVDTAFPKDFDFKALEEAWKQFTIKGKKVS